MTETEASLQTALQKQNFATAAVLLAQVVETRHELQQQRLTPVQILRLQMGCQQLLARPKAVDVSALIQAAACYLPPNSAPLSCVGQAQVPGALEGRDCH